MQHGRRATDEHTWAAFVLASEQYGRDPKTELYRWNKSWRHHFGYHCPHRSECSVWYERYYRASGRQRLFLWSHAELRQKYHYRFCSSGRTFGRHCRQPTRLPCRSTWYWRQWQSKSLHPFLRLFQYPINYLWRCSGIPSGIYTGK